MEEAGLKFIKKCVTNKRRSAWFNERNPTSYSRRSSMNCPKYLKRTARTDRFRNSPMNYLIRQLNREL